MPARGILGAFLFLFVYPLAGGVLQPGDRSPGLESLLSQLEGSAPDQIVDLGEQILARLAGVPDPEVELEVRLRLGRARISLQQYGEAGRDYQRAVQLAEQTARPKRLLDAVLGVALAAQIQGRTRAALHAYQRALALTGETGEMRLQTRIQNNLGLLHQTLGNYGAAVDAYTAALAAPETIPPLRLARRLNNLATLFNDLGQHHQALEYLEKARAAFQASGGGSTHYRILVNMAVAYRGLGRLGEARRLLLEALERQQAAGDEQARSNTLNNLALVQMDEEQPQQALETLWQALEIQTRLELTAATAATLANVAEALRRLDLGERAGDSAHASLETARRLGIRKAQVQALRTLARLHESSADLESALGLFQEAVAIDEELQAPAAAEKMAALHARLEGMTATREIARLGRSNTHRTWLLVGLAVLLAGVAASSAAQLWLRRARVTDPVHPQGPRFLAICAHCKNIRDAEGMWRSTEAALADLRQVELTHTFCPTCANKHYPDA